jgi:hypothetical protein
MTFILTNRRQARTDRSPFHRKVDGKIRLSARGRWWTGPLSWMRWTFESLNTKESLQMRRLES